jgi:hypothetical protein
MYYRDMCPLYRVLVDFRGLPPSSFLTCVPVPTPEAVGFVGNGFLFGTTSLRVLSAFSSSLFDGTDPLLTDSRSFFFLCARNLDSQYSKSAARL